MPTEEELAEAGIRSFDKDLRRMSRDELLEHFGSASGRLVLTRLFRNLGWQIYERVRDQKDPPVDGNLRSSWYRYAKPILARIPDDDDLVKDPYDTLGRMLAELVLERKLFRYADLGIVDENWENRRIGTTRPEVVVFTEKTGWVRWLRQAHTRWGVTTLALGGAPSAITSTYTVEHLLQVLPDPPPRVRLIGVVDYDPSGRAIAEAFQRQLAQAGLPDTDLATVIHPRHYAADELELFAFELPRRQKTLNARWLEVTGGVGGREVGLEAESLPSVKVTELVGRLVEGPAGGRGPGRPGSTD